MSEADTKLDNAREQVSDAVRELSEILIHECSGYEEYAKEFKEEMEEAFIILRKAKKLLGSG